MTSEHSQAAVGDGAIRPGTVIDGRYRVKDLLGSGGFATVYLAVDLETDRELALKLLDVDPDLMDLDTYRARFVREAEIASRIDHPNCVQIFDYGVAGSKRLPFLVMERLEGHDLDTEIQTKGPLSPSRTVDLFLPMLEALGRGHDLGIIHRDLKPENLFLCNPDTEEERLVLLDFGVAKLDDKAAVRLTVTGQIFGTPVFAAPEWIRKQIATPALDVYQVGLILAETLTGEAVVREENPFECLNIHCQAKLELPVDLIYGPLAMVFTRSLALDHEARFANAHELREALAAVDVAGLPRRILPGPRRSLVQPDGSRPTAELAGTITAAELFDEDERRRGGTPLVTWVALGVAVIALAAVALVVAWVIDREDPEANAAVAMKKTETITTDRGASETRVEALPTVEDTSNLVVTVQSTPEGAKIYDGEALIGETPKRVVFDAEDDPARVLRVELAGHLTTTVNVSPRSGPLVTAKLEPSGGERAEKRRRGRSKAPQEDGEMEVLP